MSAVKTPSAARALRKKAGALPTVPAAAPTASAAPTVATDVISALTPPAKRPVVRKSSVKPAVVKTALAPTAKRPSNSASRRVTKVPAPLQPAPLKATSLEPHASAVALPLAKPKNKLVRDSFTIPKAEYLVLENLKLRAANLKRPTKKSEVLRAGVAVLQAMGDKAFLAALAAVPSLKTGRPKRVDAAIPASTSKAR